MSRNTIKNALDGIDRINELVRRNEEVRQKFSSITAGNSSVFSYAEKISIEPIEATNPLLRKYGESIWDPNMKAMTAVVAVMIVCCILL